MPDQNTAPGADAAAAARRSARWAASACPTLAAVPEPGPQQAWMVMHAIAQACGDPAMRLVGRIGQALLLTNSRNTPAMTGWDAVPPPGAALAGVTHRDIRHRLELAEAMADTLDALAVHPTLVRDDRIRLPDALRAYVQGATAALAGEPRPGHPTPGSAQPGRALDAPHLDTAYHPAASHPAGWADELARRAFAAFEQDRLDDARELIDAANRVDPVRGPRWQWIRSRVDARADPSLSPAPAAVAAATSSSPDAGRVASPMSAPPAAAPTGAGDHPSRGAQNDSRADLWPAPTRLRGRVCSMAWRSLRMSELIRQIVERTYRSHIGLPTEWSPEQQRLFLDREAARLSHRSAELAAELAEAATAEWARRMGQAPDYLTSVGLRNNATVQAREQVLTEELYALVPQDPDDELEEQSPQPVDWGNPDRWRTTRRSEPTEAIQTLVARLWPDRSDWFAIKAEYLLQARSEDGHELPNSAHSPLARELASLVEADLADDGLPTG